MRWNTEESQPSGCRSMRQAKTRMRKLVQKGRMTSPTKVERHFGLMRAIAKAQGREMTMQSAVAAKESQTVRQTMAG